MPLANWQWVDGSSGWVIDMGRGGTSNVLWVTPRTPRLSYIIRIAPHATTFDFGAAFGDAKVGDGGGVELEAGAVLGSTSTFADHRVIGWTWQYNSTYPITDDEPRVHEGESTSACHTQLQSHRTGEGCVEPKIVVEGLKTLGLG